ncbi:ADP-ribosylation factor [Cladobotryum mycophilum]|uniref:ADP-ribosylation factor n=1 Tax=Cladobotryum mycophilum TaxID=491253 RepID=A0ABR0SXR7_9HYPO
MFQIKQWFGGKKEYSGLFFGLDAVGKTTLLYKLKLGEIVTTIPTIGFNVETIPCNGSEFTLWDVGGCDKIRPLIRHYIGNDRFIIFMHDCTDQTRLDEAIAEFRFALEAMTQVEGRHVWVLFNKQDMLPLADRERIINEHRQVYEATAFPYRQVCSVEFLDLPGFSATTGDRIHDLLPRINAVLNNEGKPVSKPDVKSDARQDPPTKKEILQPPSREELVGRINDHLKEAGSAEDFLKLFESGDLPAWDHFTHLRAGYCVMLDCFANKRNIIACSDIFIEHLERLREKNPQRFRNTTHRTMTVFWLLQLQVATLQYQKSKGLESLPSSDDFGEVLLHEPSLMHSGFWREYYTKDFLFSADARDKFLPPDIKPFPSIISSPQKSQQPKLGITQSIYLTTALEVVHETLTSGQRRGEIIKNALQKLQSRIIQLRAESQETAPYSETQAYFWIQFTHAALSSHETERSAVLSREPDQRSSSSPSVNVDKFKEIFKITGQEWREYYSLALWESVGARMEFRVPDLKPLPQFIPAA